jgi:hypothetical protein
MSHLLQPTMFDNKISLKENSIKFRTISLGLLKECSSRDYGLTKEVLVQKNRRFCDKNALEVFDGFWVVNLSTYYEGKIYFKARAHFAQFRLPCRQHN